MLRRTVVLLEDVADIKYNLQPIILAHNSRLKDQRSKLSGIVSQVNSICAILRIPSKQYDSREIEK